MCMLTSFFCLAMTRLTGNSALYCLGDLLLEMDRLEDAFSAYAKCHQIASKIIPKDARTAYTARQLGIVATKQGDVGTAM